MAKSTLNWFQKHSNDDAVRLNVVVTYENGDTAGKDATLSDKDLTAHAVAAGRSSWDESDVLALLAAPTALNMAVAMPPVPVAAPAGEEAAAS